MGTADRLSHEDEVAAQLRMLDEAKVQVQHIQAMSQSLGRLINALADREIGLIGLDKAAELMDECAIVLQNVREYEPTASDIAADLGEAKFEAKRDFALMGA